MGALLDELLESVKKSSQTEQLRIICDQITKEEVVNLDAYLGPAGPNVFLSLPAYIHKRTQRRHFVCLDREANDEFVVSHWTSGLKQGSPLNKIETWRVNEVTPTKILKFYIEQLQFVKGE